MQKSFQDEDDVGMARDLAWLSDISASKRYAWNTPSSVESNSPNKNKSSAKRSQLKQQISEMINCLESSPIKNDFYKPPKTPEVKQEVTELVTTPEQKKPPTPFKQISPIERGENFVLKRNYETLLSVMQEQENIRTAQDQKLESLNQQIEEVKAEYEVSLEDLRLQNVKLKQKLRMIQNEENLAPLFDLYENDIEKLQNQLRRLREDLMLEVDQIQFKVVGGLDDEQQILNKSKQKQLDSLKTQIKKLTKQLIEREAEVAELKKHERKWNMSRKCLENISRRQGQLQSEVGKKTKFLKQNEQIFNEMIQEIESLNSQNEELKEKNQELIQDNVLLVDEVKLMKDLASQNGINQHTLEKIHQNLSKRGNNKNRFALNLLNRLKKEILPLKDIKLSQLVENAILEVEQICDQLESGSIREDNLLQILVDMQDDKNMSMEVNRKLRKNILSVL